MLYLQFELYRIPVELGCAQSLMPLHSVTASALLISKLSTKPGGWAWLSEGIYFCSVPVFVLTAEFEFYR